MALPQHLLWTKTLILRLPPCRLDRQAVGPEVRRSSSTSGSTRTTASNLTCQTWAPQLLRCGAVFCHPPTLDLPVRAPTAAHLSCTSTYRCSPVLGSGTYRCSIVDDHSGAVLNNSSANVSARHVSLLLNIAIGGLLLGFAPATLPLPRLQYTSAMPRRKRGQLIAKLIVKNSQA